MDRQSVSSVEDRGSEMEKDLHESGWALGVEATARG